MKRIYQLGTILTCLVLCVTSCKKLVEVPAPVTSVNADNVFNNDFTAQQVINGIYTQFDNQDLGTYANSPANYLSLFSGLSSDEYFYQVSFGGIAQNYYENKLAAQQTTFWNAAYNNVQITNTIIEGASASTTLSSAVKKNLLAQAKFLRAFFYFYLINLYGDVPLITGTDYTVNQRASREPAANVYKQIINDLKDAEANLSSSFVNFDGTTITSERTLPNTWAAKALLARVYLYSKDYENAEIKASELIDNTAYFGMETLSRAFLKNNMEAIWQIQPVVPNENTKEARFFIIPSQGLNNNQPVALSTSLVNSFETGDQRKTTWTETYVDASTTPTTTYVYAYKYKSVNQGDPVTEYTDVFRLSEQYLIRAEARTMLGKPGATADLNVVRSRAGLDDYSGATDQAALLAAILHERQVELFSEWGQRWLDLKRTGTIDQVMSVAAVAKGSSWSSYQQWYPIPSADIKYNPNLIQNTGY